MGPGFSARHCAAPWVCAMARSSKATGLFSVRLQLHLPLQALACSRSRVRYAWASARGEPRVPIFSVSVATAAWTATARGAAALLHRRGFRSCCRALLGLRKQSMRVG